MMLLMGRYGPCGSALYFATIMSAVSDEYHVLSVDLNHTQVPESVSRNSHIELLKSDTSDPAVSERIRALRDAHGRRGSIENSRSRAGSLDTYSQQVSSD